MAVKKRKALKKRAPKPATALTPPEHVPTSHSRKQVEAMSAVGIPQEAIGRVLGIHRNTLMKHYRDELDLATEKANAAVGGSLYKNAMNGNVTAQIFWMKTRARWRESPQEHVHSGAVGSYDLTKVSDDDLERLNDILTRASLGTGEGGTGEAGGGEGSDGGPV